MVSVRIGAEYNDFNNSLAIFIKLKSLFKNSCIYNATYETVSRKSGISVSTLKRYIPGMKRRGWIRMHNGNMVFQHMSIMHRFTSKPEIFKFKILKNDTYKAIAKKLKLLAVRDLYNDLKEDQLKHNRDNIRESGRVKMSNKDISKRIQRSRSTASRLMRWGQSKGILQLFSGLKKIPDILCMHKREFMKLCMSGVVLKCKDKHAVRFGPLDVFDRYIFFHSMPNSFIFN